MDDLLTSCNSALDGGADFPRIWRDVLRAHPLVCGVPIQRMDDLNPVLEIPLLTGHRIVYDPERSDFSLTFGKSATSAI
jgi:hypothetical protein